MSIFSSRANEVAQLLVENNHTVSVAESSTGGLIAANLLSIPGASRYFLGSAVVYTIKSRNEYLDLDKDRVKKLKPLTEEMTLEFAKAARAKLDATWGLAELGVAGPGSTPYSDETGISVIAISGPIDLSVTIKTETNEREENMKLFTGSALQLLKDAIAHI